jgi:hypothetical protein
VGEEIEVRFTKHAEDQIAERELDREAIIAVVRAPEQIVYLENRPPVAQSRVRYKDKQFLWRIPFDQVGNTRWVITVYRTSQVERYWQERADED